MSAADQPAAERPVPPLPPLVDGTSRYRPVIRHRTPTVRASIAYAVASDPLAGLVTLALVTLALLGLAAIAMVLVGWVG